MSASALKAKKRSPRIETPAGASAETDGELIVLRDRHGSIAVVFDGARGVAEIVAKGDLVLAAPEGKISLRAREISAEAGRIELRADRVFEHAREVVREVEGLVQLRAERVRTIARDVWQVLAKRTRVAAEEDAAMDGKRVLLG